MTRRASLLAYTGYRQIPHRGTGLHALYRLIRYQIMDSRREYPLVALRPWDADVQTDAELVAQEDAELLIVIGYSYGVGNAVAKLVEHLDRPVDLLIAIDPVRRYGWGGADNQWGLLSKIKSLWQGQTLTLSGVREAAVYRSVNDTGLTCPIGHEIRGPQLVRDRVFGSLRNIDTYARGHQDVVIDDTCDHQSIDDRADIHADVLTLIRELIEGAR